MSNRIFAWILVGIVVFAVAIRVYNLTDRSLWFDEAFSWRLTHFSYSEIVSRTASDVHPPLYYIVLKSWTIIWGHSVTALRSFSIASSGLAIILAYSLVRYAFHHQGSALLTATLMALSAWQISLAQEARMYMVAVVLALFSTYCLLHAVRTQSHRWVWWMAYAVGVAGLAYTHYYGFFTIGAQVLWLLGYIVVMTRGRVGEILNSAVTWYGLGSLSIATLLFSPWIPIFLNQQKQVQQSFWIPAIDKWSILDTFYRMIWPVVYGPSHDQWWNVVVALLPLLILITIWAYLLISPSTYRRKQGDAIWLSILLIGVPFVLSSIVSMLTKSVYQDRYFALTHPFLLISVALFIFKLRPVLIRRLSIIGIIIMFSVLTLRYTRELNVATKPGVHGAVASLIQERKEGEPIIVSSPFIFFSVDHYLTEEYALPDTARLYSEATEVAHFAGAPILTPEDTVYAHDIEDNKESLWVIDTTGFGGSELKVPVSWKQNSRIVFPEVFGYQGDIIVNHYVRTP